LPMVIGTLVVETYVFKPELLTKVLRVEHLSGDKILIRLGQVFRTFYHLEDGTTVIVQHHHAQVRHRVVVPKGVAVVKEGDISGDEYVHFFSRQRMTHRRAVAPVNAARSAVCVDGHVRPVGGDAHEIGIPHTQAVGKVQVDLGGKGIDHLLYE